MICGYEAAVTVYAEADGVIGEYIILLEHTHTDNCYHTCSYPDCYYEYPDICSWCGGTGIDPYPYVCGGTLRSDSYSSSSYSGPYHCYCTVCGWEDTNCSIYHMNMACEQETTVDCMDCLGSGQIWKSGHSCPLGVKEGKTELICGYPADLGPVTP